MLEMTAFRLWTKKTFSFTDFCRVSSRATQTTLNLPFKIHYKSWPQPQVFQAAQIEIIFPYSLFQIIFIKISILP